MAVRVVDSLARRIAVGRSSVHSMCAAPAGAQRRFLPNLFDPKPREHPTEVLQVHRVGASRLCRAEHRKSSSPADGVAQQQENAARRHADHSEKPQRIPAMLAHRSSERGHLVASDSRHRVDLPTDHLHPPELGGSGKFAEHHGVGFEDAGTAEGNSGAVLEGFQLRHSEPELEAQSRARALPPQQPSVLEGAR